MQVEVEVSDKVGTITLNRPEARNALSGRVTRLLDEAIVDLDQREEIGAIILTGADPAFCAGFDLRSLSAELHAVAEQQHTSTVAHRGLMPVHSTPVIGAINGAAVTGGLELAMSCDFLIASDRARFADTHARVGVVPGGGMSIRLPELIGLDRARRMSFTGDFIDARTAYEWGLVVEVVPHESLMDRARELASSIASLPAENVREVRRVYDVVGALLGQDAWAAEAHASGAWMAERFNQGGLIKSAVPSSHAVAAARRAKESHRGSA
jgi:enoyl-CoA hydratase